MSLLNSAKQRFQYLDSIRAIAALYVVMHHAMLQYYFIKPHNLSTAEQVIFKIFSDGHLAVDTFIVLSGFSLMLSIIRNNYKLKGGIVTFIKRRIIRIVPAYYATIAVSLLLATTLISVKTSSSWDMSVNANFKDFVIHLLFLQDIFLSTSTKINYSLWSIAVEFRLYLIFPLIVWLWRRKGPFSALLFACISTITISVLLIVFKIYYPDINLFRSGVSPFIILFTSGMLAADLAFSGNDAAVRIRRFLGNLNTLSIILLFIIAAGVYKIIPSEIDNGGPSTNTYNLVVIESKDIIFGLISAAFLVLCATTNALTIKKKSILKVLCWEPLILIGTFSYSLYLIHPFLLQLLTQYILAGMHLSTFGKTCFLILVGTPLVVFISYLFFLIFEKPFLVTSQNVKIKEVETIAAQNPAI
ncbi:MAG: acyltransferase [Bacteroidetes bacterium]|jgi:peptidoglycan/LPS O-acetylase OafA/YrhL|nr:acyltransferase [Bacteroidota bacterium]